MRTDALRGQLSIQQLEQLLDALDRQQRTIEQQNVTIEQQNVTIEQQNVTIEQQQRTIEQQNVTIEQFNAELMRLKERLARLDGSDRRAKAADAGGSGAATGANYSLAAEERRRRKRRKKKSPGRRPNEVKFAQATSFQDVFPEGAKADECRLLRERAVWRLQEGKAVLVGYRIFVGPGGKEGRIEGVTPRCEYGIEILVVLAHLVYIIGISLDKACALLGFFCQLPLSKSQADALLRQLAQHWEEEFVTLCDLLAYAAVVYMDETSWKVGKDYLSLWALASDMVRVFVYGCNRDKETLDLLLAPDLFEGIGVSDDAAVYRHRFKTAQKCWAHLLRKAIRLTLLQPRKKKYRRFLEELLDIYRAGKRAAADGRLGEAGRRAKVAELEERLAKLCRPHWRETTPDMAEHERDFTRLVNELVGRMLDEELFTFVLHPEVEATNNISERNVRDSGQAREAGRTSKTAAGAYRRSVIVSVLESLRANLERFTLASVLEEIKQWLKDGLSLFTRQWHELLEARPELEANTS